MRQVELSVPDMSCGHCKAAVEAALATVPGAAIVMVDLAAHKVTVAGDVPASALCAALDSAGFPAVVLG